MISEFLLVDARVNLGRAANVWGHLLKRCYPTLGDDLSKSLTACLMRGHRNQSGNDCFSFAEIFAGQANLSKEFARAGFEGTAIDIRFGSSHDILTVKGMRLCLDAVCSLKRQAMLWVATACSSFVILCRAQSRRDASTNFLGDLQRRFVLTGNALCEASSMLFFVAYALQIYVTLENPTSSVIDKCPSLSGVFAYVKPWCFTTYMGAAVETLDYLP